MAVEIRFGANVNDLNVENTQIVLEGGETVTGDIIIGADGLSSVLSNGVQATID